MPLISSAVTEAQNASNTDSTAFTETRQPNLISTEVTNLQSPFPGSSNPPPKASAAPGPAGNNVFTGLAEALNSFQQRLVKQGIYEIADEYEIEFAPASLGDSTIYKPGTIEKNKTPMDRGNTAKDKLDPETNSVNKSARIVSAYAGMSIAQFIDQQLRNSSYIMDQSTIIYDEATGEKKPQTSLGSMAWYKVSVTATPKAPYIDSKRNDFAYKIKYVISPYSINTMISDYFPDPTFRGVHKTYNYWFTGLNKEILSFEQSLNAQYRVIISNTPSATDRVATNNRISKTFQPVSDQSNMGASGKTNEPSANAADWLYNTADYKSIKMRIVGDPSWLQQGEVATGVSAKTFTFNPFNDDGTINFDAGEAVFDIGWVAPTDYNFNTGIVDIGTNKRSEVATYTVTGIKSYFKQGKFEQDLDGVLVLTPLSGIANNSDIGRTQPSIVGVDQSRVGSGVSQAQLASNTDSSLFTNTQQPNLISPAVSAAQLASNSGSTGATPDVQNESTLQTENGPPTVAPQPPVEPPTSNGDITFGDNGRVILNPAVLAAQGVSNSDNPQLQNREY